MDEIIQGSSYGAVFSWEKPTAANPLVSEDANPTSATVEVVRARTGESLALADDEATVSGNETSFTVPPSLLTRIGNYSIYMTAVFADGTTAVRSRQFRVLATDGVN